MKGKYTYKDELNHKYGPLTVIRYTDIRVPYNGCIKWECQCKDCGAISLRNGNSLRFSKNPTCTICGRRKR